MEYKQIFDILNSETVDILVLNEENNPKFLKDQFYPQENVF